MKVYAVDIFARYEFDGYKLFFKHEDAAKEVEEHNSKLAESCKKDECCFARVEERTVK